MLANRLSLFLAMFTASASIVTATNTNLLPPPNGNAWKTWTANPRFAPHAEVELNTVLTHTTKGDGEASGKRVPILVLHSEEAGAYARWTTLTDTVEPGKFYEFSVWQRSRGVDFDNVRTPLILSWCHSETGEGAPIQRDYVDRYDANLNPEGWTRRWRRIQAPPGTRSLRIELSLRWAAAASVWWHAPSLVEVSAPAPRKARIATTRISPESSSTVEKNTQLIADMFDRVAREYPDLILFSENLVDRNVKQPLFKKAQVIPGPLTNLLAEKARQHRIYVATSLHEVDDLGHFYTTAVLIDREGRIAAKYRKTHLAMGEAENGIVAGNEYVVADTDFGRVGLLVCWDNWFPEPTRILSLRGAEIILLPIAGDGVPDHWDAVSRTRAMDNGVYFVSSATVTDIPSRIINPAGEVLAEVTGNFGHAIYEIDLNQQWRVNWLSVGPGLGEAKSLYQQERRQDTYAPLAPSFQACPE